MKRKGTEIRESYEKQHRSQKLILNKQRTPNTDIRHQHGD